MSELNETFHVTFNDASVVTVPLVTNLTATNAAPTAKTVGDALASKVDADDIMEHVQITFNSVQSDSQGVILADGQDIPVDDTQGAPSIKEALTALDEKTGEEILYEDAGDPIKTVVDGIKGDVEDLETAVGGLSGETIPAAAGSQQTIKAAIEAAAGRTGADIDVSGTDTRKISAAITAAETALGDALKMVEQTLTTAQKNQVFANLGITDLVENGVKASAQTLSSQQKKQATANLGIGSILTPELIEPTGIDTTHWTKEAGGYVRIGAIVFVIMRVKTTQAIAAGGSIVYADGSFPHPLQDDSGNSASVQLGSTASSVFPYISSGGALRFGTQTEAMNADRTIYTSGMYITGDA